LYVIPVIQFPFYPQPNPRKAGFCKFNPKTTKNKSSGKEEFPAPLFDKSLSLSIGHFLMKKGEEEFRIYFTPSSGI